MALSALRWRLVTRSTSEKRKRYTSSWEARAGERDKGQLEQAKGGTWIRFLRGVCAWIHMYTGHKCTTVEC